MGVNGINTYLASELKGLPVFGDYSGVNKVAIQSLINLVKPEVTTTHRGFLDQMSPSARNQLIVELNALLAAVENV